MANWRDVINAYAAAEPSRPFSTRGMDLAEKIARVDALLKLSSGNGRYIGDFEGRQFRISLAFVRKLAKYANHAAYAGWIATTILSPLEVWEHPDPGSSDVRPRRHYFGAYVGASGATSHLVVAAFGKALINSFRLDNVTAADHKRFGDCLFVGYSPVLQPFPIAKGAPFPMAPLPV
jgi:hypothetical protein